MEIYDHDDYREFIREWLQNKPKNGYGQLSRLAQHLGVNATLVSQIMSGQKNLTEDQAFSTGEFLGLNGRESLYLILLVQRERASNHRLKQLLSEQIQSRRAESQSLKTRIPDKRNLAFEEQAVFYSDWLYTATHAMTSVPHLQSVDAIAEKLQVSRQRIKQIVDWLVEHHMCIEKSGELSVGPSTTFVGPESPLANRHHANWRQRAMHHMTDYKPENFFFTGPFSVSEEDFKLLRKECVQLIDRLAKRVSTSSPEMVGVIDVDLFRLLPNSGKS